MGLYRAHQRLLWWLRWERICLLCRKPRFNPWVRKISWRRKWQSNPVFLPGEFNGQRRLAGYSPYSPWGHKELDTTEWLFQTFSFYVVHLCMRLLNLHNNSIGRDSSSPDCLIEKLPDITKIVIEELIIEFGFLDLSVQELTPTLFRGTSTTFRLS